MLPFNVILLVLDPILVLNKRSGLLLKLIGDILGFLLLFSDSLANFLQFCIFLPK